MKKFLVISTVIILVSISFVSNVKSVSIEKDTEVNKISTLNEITVPDDFSTIQEAIDYSYNYGVIRVKPGVYYENIIVDVIGLEIRGENPYNTIIDGRDGGDVITIESPIIVGDVIVSGFTIRNSGDDYSGITIKASYGSIIYDNIIKNNGFGVKVDSSSGQGEIFCNNFLDNNQNAFDLSYNMWYSTYYNQGNYWDDYTGTDFDGDGFGDSPYLIPGGSSRDWRPKLSPYKWNLAPEKPIIFGPVIGEPDAIYTYTIGTTDFNNDEVKYEINWGDGKEYTTEFMPSGKEFRITHEWDNEGFYVIGVIAIDEHGLESEEATLGVSMPRSKKLVNHLINNILQKFPLLTRLLDFRV